MKKARAVLLASGRGSNAEALWQSTQKGELNIEWVGCLTDKKDSGVQAIAARFGVPCHVLEQPQALESRVLELNPDWVVCAGYMRRIASSTIEALRDAAGWSHIVNIHPSLLPAFRGMQAYAQAWDSGVQVTGVTVHLVEAEIDGGPILAQEAFSISACETVDQVEARGLEIEHWLYPVALQKLIEGGRPRVSPR